jgi:hypothetical protein
MPPLTRPAPNAPVTAPSEAAVIGFSYPALDDDEHAARLLQLVQLSASRLGVRVIDEPATTREDQVGAIARLMAQRIGALICVAIAPDDAGLNAALAACDEAGIPTTCLGARAGALGGFAAAELDARAALAAHVGERLHGPEPPRS